MSKEILSYAQEVFDIEIQGLTEVSQKIDEQFSKAVQLIADSKGRVVVTGMGKSGLVGKKIAATFASTGTRSFFMHPAEAYHGDLGMIDTSDVILAISNSGETSELLKLLSFFKDNRNSVIAMANRADSTLAKHSDFFINIGISREACPLELAPTTSTTVTMAMGDALAVALMKTRGFKEENFAKFHPGGSLGRKLLSKAEDYMRKENLPVVDSSDQFEEVIGVITKGRMGIAVVLQNDEVTGVITDGDVRRGISKFRDKILSAKACELMTNNPKSIVKELKLALAEELMQKEKISSLLVVEDEKLIGILSRYDI